MSVSLPGPGLSAPELITLNTENAQEFICKVHFLLDKTTCGVLDPTPLSPGRVLSNQGMLRMGRLTCGAQIEQQYPFSTTYSNRTVHLLGTI